MEHFRMRLDHIENVPFHRANDRSALAPVLSIVWKRAKAAGWRPRNTLRVRYDPDDERSGFINAEEWFGKIASFGLHFRIPPRTLLSDINYGSIRPAHREGRGTSGSRLHQWKRRVPLQKPMPLRPVHPGRDFVLGCPFVVFFPSNVHQAIVSSYSIAELLTKASFRLSGDQEGTFIVPWPP
jgi:hypothetical protein